MEKDPHLEELMIGCTPDLLLRPGSTATSRQLEGFWDNMCVCARGVCGIVTGLVCGINHIVWKSWKMSHSILRAKRATFTFLVGKNSWKKAKNSSETFLVIFKQHVNPAGHISSKYISLLPFGGNSKWCGQQLVMAQRKTRWWQRTKEQTIAVLSAVHIEQIGRWDDDGADGSI